MAQDLSSTPPWTKTDGDENVKRTDGKFARSTQTVSSESVRSMKTDDGRSSPSSKSGGGKYGRSLPIGEKRSGEPPKQPQERKDIDGDRREILTSATIIGDSALKIAAVAEKIGFKELKLIFSQVCVLMFRAQEVAKRETKDILAHDAKITLPAQITYRFAEIGGKKPSQIDCRFLDEERPTRPGDGQNEEGKKEGN